MTDNDTREYRLTEEYRGIVRSGLVLQGDETVKLDEDEYQRHEDVLEPVDAGTPTDSDSTDVEDEGDSS